MVVEAAAQATVADTAEGASEITELPAFDFLIIFFSLDSLNVFDVL